jgi:cystathionine beta-lyase
MFDFDEIIDRRHSNAEKWDEMERLFGLSAEDGGLPMWVADMDFRSPPEVNAAIAEAAAHGIHGYYGDDAAYRAAICGWMQRRHGWEVAPEAIATTNGVVGGVAIALRAFTEPGDGVVLFTPVYHAFARMVKANGRNIVESVLAEHDGRYGMDLEALAAQLTGREKLLILCSPHNPGGRIWDAEELRAVAAFCREHDLILISDEIHHDIVFPDEKHVVMPLAAPESHDRLVMLTAASKVFNIAGGLTGNAIIPDPALRARFDAAHRATGKTVNRIGVMMVTAAYAHGDAWVDALCTYLAKNAAIFEAGLAAIPGVRLTPMQSTYLAWADFRGTGIDQAGLNDRVRRRARIAPSDGPTFGTGGEGFLRFNLGTQRARVEEAVARLQAAFSDLQ